MTDAITTLSTWPDGVAKHAAFMRLVLGFTWTEATARAEKAEAAVARVRAITYASDDGSEYNHTHDFWGGQPDCPACWAQTIRRALDGDDS